MELSDPLQYLPGVGPKLAKKLARLNLFTIKDLIYHIPFRYEDYSKILKINEAKLGEAVTLQGEVWSVKNVYTRFRRVLTQVVLNDGSGSVELTWFNQPWLSKSISSGDKLQVSGKVDKRGSKLTMTAPDWEKIDGGRSVHTGRLVPVYPETYGLSSKWFRNKIAELFPKIPEIPDLLSSIAPADLYPLEKALRLVHFPEGRADVASARERLSFDELFFIQLATLKKRGEWREKKVIRAFGVNQGKIDDFLNSLPFELTPSQRKVVSEILSDLDKSYPMNRLLQGEVGSGKTVVAAVAIFATFQNGLRSFFMAPTEILAFQHFETLRKLLEPYKITVGIYTGSRKMNEGDVIVGTHALLSKTIAAENVGLIVIDEQQRFGVGQRSLLRSKAKLPHFLSMTATPIPRTVALTLYGDLDLSTITELPKGRKPIKTFVVPQRKRQDSYGFIEKKIKQGDQVYVITPLIEESETNESAKAAKKEYEVLQKVFPKLKLGLLHGRMKSKEKEEVINKFKSGDIQVLISTSVVEVGVDVPNATIMVIEGAERFGLAQLHQLRGRIGRGSKESFCLLFCEEEIPQNINRLKNLEKTNNGLELSELDLRIRGSGDIFGERQSGRWDLKVASLTDLDLIQKTRLCAEKILNEDPNLDKHPGLASKLQELASDVMPD